VVDIVQAKGFRVRSFRPVTPQFHAFWTERHLATLASVRPDASAHLVPVGVTLDFDAGVARIITSATSVKARHVRGSGGFGLRVAACQVDGRRWSTIEGIAFVRTASEEVADAERRYAERFRTPRPNSQRVVIEFVVDRVLGNQ
jgi:PPOX class probable F420-dependent enzyme